MAILLCRPGRCVERDAAKCPCHSARPQRGIYHVRVNRLLVELEDTPGNSRPVVCRRLSPSTFAHRTAQFRIAQETDQRSPQRGRAFRLDEQPLATVLDDVRVAWYPRGDDGPPGGHRLQQHDTEALLSGRGGTEDVRRLVVADEILGRN